MKSLLGSMLILLCCSLCSNAVLTFSVTPPNEVPNSLPSEQQSPVLEENQNAQGVKVEVQKEEKIKHLVVLYHLNNLKNDEIIANGF